MNETTIIEKKNQPVENKKESKPWKAVSLGGVAGILMGAGAMYAASAAAQEASEAETPEEGISTDSAVPEATVDEKLPFSEAFEAARAEVGPGGVFHWHGGIYNTYTAAEWEAMSDAEKDAFAQRVAPEVEASAVSTPTDAQPEVVVVHHVHHVVEDDITPVSQDDDVRIVGVAEYEGHAVVGLDMDGDNQADVAVIDVDNNGELSDPDVVVTKDGDMATIGELTGHDNGDVYMASEDASASQDDDVRIVSRTEYEGHNVYGLDLDGDNQVDVAVIDVDDSGSLSGPDIVFNGDGDYASIDELNNAAAPNAGLYEVDNSDMYDTPIEPDVDGGQFV